MDPRRKKNTKPLYKATSIEILMKTKYKTDKKDVKMFV